MNGVDVTRSAVQRAMSSCTEASNELQNASKNLKKYYEAAGSGWKDSKYRELGNIIIECNGAIVNPITQLNECLKTLIELDKILEIYENA